METPEAKPQVRLVPVEPLAVVFVAGIFAGGALSFTLMGNGSMILVCGVAALLTWKLGKRAGWI